MGTRELNSHSRHQDILLDVLQQSVSCLWVINFPVGLHSALNLEEDCSWGSAEPKVPIGMVRFIHPVLPGLGMLCPDALGTASSKACSRQG